MPRVASSSVKPTRRAVSKQKNTRYSVGLPLPLAREVEQYAGSVDASLSKAIVTLVRLGLETQEQRKREFFKKMKANLASDNPADQDRVIDEFRMLTLTPLTGARLWMKVSAALAAPSPSTSRRSSRSRRLRRSNADRGSCRFLSGPPGSSRSISRCGNRSRRGDLETRAWNEQRRRDKDQHFQSHEG